MKGKLLRKLNSIGPVVSLNQDRVLQIKALNGYVESFANNASSFNLKSLIVSRENQPKKIDQKLIDEEIEGEEDDKENIVPSSSSILKSKHQEEESKEAEESDDHDHHRRLPEIDTSFFRRPDMNSDSLFDPNLLAAFEKAVKEHAKTAEPEIEEIDLEEQFKEEEEQQEHPWKLLEVFGEKCPPGGTNTVILYTTTLRGIRKTFEDCNKIRFLLESFKIVYVERDTSMHMKFKEELWKILEGKILPPRLFVKGRYIGGAEEVLTLHEQGKLKPLFAEIPVRNSNDLCENCDGVRFFICLSCSGSKKIVAESENVDECRDCNENGLIICPYCCC